MDDLLQQGITAYKAGKRDEARNIFITIVKQSPDSETAWNWMYQVSNNDQEQIHCLKQILRINPNNEKANGLLNQLMNFESPLQSPTSVSQTSNIQNQVPSLKKCPYCAELIQSDAIVCRFCGRDLSPQQKPTTIQVNSPPTRKPEPGVGIKQDDLDKHFKRRLLEEQFNTIAMICFYLAIGVFACLCLMMIW